MPIVDFPTREDDRTTSRLRRRAFALPRSTRRVKRQAPPPPSPTGSDSGSSGEGGEFSESDGEESSDEEEEKKKKEKVLNTGSSQIASQSAPATVANPLPTPSSLRTSAASVVSSPMPASSTSKTSTIPDVSSSTSTSSTSRISAVPVVSPPTIASSTLITSAVPVASVTATEPRHQLSPRPSQTSTESSTATTGAGFNPTAEAVQDNRPSQTRQHKSLSHGATVALEGVGIATGIALILGICFLLFRRWKKRQARLYLDQPRPPPAMRGGWNNIWRERFKPAGNGAGSDSGGLNSDNAVDRQERLERVRTSLLGAKELNGGLMRGHSRNNSLNMSSDGVNHPTKAFLRKNSETGQMMMEKSAHQRTRSHEDNGRVEIEASGQWDDPVTVAREGPSRRGSSGVGVGPGILPPLAFKPTARAPNNAGEYDEHDYGWNADPYRMSELSTVRDGIAPSERGSAIFSAWKGRERERERSRRDRDSRATTIAKWQSPISWVKDQVERTDNGIKQGQENRENKGMSKLPG